MSHRDDKNSHFSLRQSRPGLGRDSAHDPVENRRSFCSAVSQDARSPLTVSEVGVVTPAQAYASAVRSGETHDRVLYHTIERRQPERKGKPDPQFVPSYLGDPGSPERGLSFAQRLYASAVSDKSSTLLPSNIPVLPISGGSQASCDVPHRKTSRSTSLFDTSSEVSQSFNPSDLYHSSVAPHRFPSQDSASPEVSTMCPPLLLPASQIPKFLPAARLSYPANPLRSYTSLTTGVQKPRPALRQSRNISMEAQSHSTPVLSIHEAVGLQGVSIETHQDFHPLVVAGGAIPSLSPLEQQLVIPPSSSPPPSEVHERLPNLFEEVVADIAPVVVQPLTAIPQGSGLPDVSLEPPPDVNYEEVPLYSLIDEQLPPPTFDDLQETSATEASAERPPVLQPQTFPQGVIEAPSSQSSPPSQSPPPSSHGSTVYAPGKAPAYALLDQTPYSVGTRKGIRQGAKISSVTTWRSSDPSSSDPSRAIPVDFKWSNQPSRSMSATPTSGAVPHDGRSMTPLLSSSSRPLSVLSSHFPDSQFTRTPCDRLAVHKSTTSPPSLVNYHAKPTAEQSGQLFPLPLAPKSGTKPPEYSNTVSQARRDSRPHVNAAKDNDAIDTLTRSMSDTMGRPSSDTHSLAYENLSSGILDIFGTSLGNQQNIPITIDSHPSGIINSTGSLNQEAYRPENWRLIQESHQRPTHAETGGRVGYRIQGLRLANHGVTTNILSSQPSPRTIPPLGPNPSAYSHDELQTEPSRTFGDESNFSQFDETVALSTRRSYYSNHSPLPSRSFPCPVQPSHHLVDRDAHEPVAPSGSIPPQQQINHSLENLDPMKRGVLPPPPPPIALRPWNVPQMPQTSGAKDRFRPDNKAPMPSNDLPKKTADDELLDPSSAPAYAFYESIQR